MMRPTDLISPSYLAEQVILHASPRGYGGRGAKWAEMVRHLMTKYRVSSVLDYGCGQGTLVAELRRKARGVRFSEYDPAIPSKAQLPSFADLVVCTDVLEHIEHDKLDAVLAHVRLLARKRVFFVISTKATHKVLTDGRNAHLTIESRDWWKARLVQSGFRLTRIAPKIGQQKPTHEWVCVVKP